MTEAELFQHYEKLYFHEQQRKEQIFSRLSIPLAVMVALVGFYAVIIATDYKKLEGCAAFAFGFCAACSAELSIIGAYFFTDALLGKMDQALSTPNSLEAWRRDLQAYYAGETDADRLVADSIRSALYADYMNCASLTTVNNDRKSSSLYYCNMALIFSSATALVAYAVAKFPSL
ncbi:hypothetical protein C1170_06335 [Stutzerimonas frequens]|uniref:SMODS and SLOG-associating 2TM effector domain-containing protein n=1 Tax=Stutzerimonas frequens TaxID=2968969 RepID=A0ABX6XYG3_9GAMM|nr:hypothetical protein [Stutzerimonas frequens]MCQ4302685.1 hypothetical protein [Stutzerimonas frequens]PNF52550.1 hypothetical protein C1170_06335 [Stutzerimonas frequens]QPT19032.1 hypothetical protein I6G34_06645 [Stutzerimonas frequens]